MTTQEQQMLQGLADRINRTQLADKDADAENFIQRTLGENPDALYVMAQTVLVQGYALEQAQKQIADLRGQIEQTRQQAGTPKHSSFLGNLLGRHDEQQRAVPPPPPPAPPLPSQAQYAGAGYGQGLAYPAGGYPIGGMPPQGGGFLRSAMQTATGVAAGALAFEGIESLMHGFGHAAGYGSEFGGGGYGPAAFDDQPREEIINNYYGDSAAGEHGGDRIRDDAAGQQTDASAFSNASGVDGGRLQDASYNTDSNDDGTNADDLSGTGDTDYSSQGDDSMLSDNIGDGGGLDSEADDSGGDFGAIRAASSLRRLRVAPSARSCSGIGGA